MNPTRTWAMCVAFASVAIGLPTVLNGAGVVEASKGVYSAAEWLPLRHGVNGAAITIGCTFNSPSPIPDDCGGTYHPYWALDIGAPTGTAVYSAGAGKVVVAIGAGATRPGRCGDATRRVIVDHGNGTFSLYEHLSIVSAGVGDWVTRATKIGEVGATGIVTNCYQHLHFEITNSKTSFSNTAHSLAIGSLKACHPEGVVLYPNSLPSKPTTWERLPRNSANTVYSDCPTVTKALTGGASITVGNAYVAVPFAASAAVTGGAEPRILLSVSGAPAWAAVTYDGSALNVSGTPTAAKTFTFSARIGDQVEDSVTVPITVIVSGPPTYGGASVTTFGNVGTPFSTSVAFTGGQAPFSTIAVLPAWLATTVQVTNPRRLVLTGTPNEIGTWQLAVVVTDARGGSATVPVTVIINPNATSIEGQIIRRNDGVSWVIVGGQRRHLPDYATDLCAQFVEHRNVALVNLTFDQANSIPEGSAWTCSLEGAVLHAMDQPDPKPAYWYHNGTRHWLPDAWTYDFAINNGWLVEIPTEAAIKPLADGGTETPKLRAEAIPRNTIIRRLDGISWVVDANGVRHHIPYSQDDACWRRVRGLSVSATGLTAGQSDALPETDAWPCIIGNAIVHSDNGAYYFVDTTNTRRWIQDWETVTALLRSYPDYGAWPTADVLMVPEGPWMPKMINPANVANTLICAANGNCYAVDGAGTRHWIPSYPDFVCWRYANHWGVSRGGLSDEQLNSLAETNAWGCNMSGSIVVTDTGASYYMEGNTTRRWIQDPESYWCYVGRGAPVIRGVPQGEANGIYEGAWMPRCLDPNRVKNHVVRVSDGTAYFIDASGWWYWIPNSSIWGCITSKYSVLISTATWEQVNSIRRERGVWAYCGQ